MVKQDAEKTATAMVQLSVKWLPIDTSKEKRVEFVGDLTHLIVTAVAEMTEDGVNG